MTFRPSFGINRTLSAHKVCVERIASESIVNLRTDPTTLIVICIFSFVFFFVSFPPFFPPSSPFPFFSLNSFSLLSCLSFCAASLFLLRRRPSCQTITIHSLICRKYQAGIPDSFRPLYFSIETIEYTGLHHLHESRSYLLVVKSPKKKPATANDLFFVNLFTPFPTIALFLNRLLSFNSLVD